MVIKRFPVMADRTPAVTSALTRRGDTWEATGGNGDVATFDDVAEAVRSLEALIFVAGEVIQIATAGLVKAADVLPWLRLWVEADEGEPLDIARWAEQEPAGTWWEELVTGYCESEARLLPDRAIVFDDRLCAVFEADALRVAVLLDDMGHPVFLQQWATLELHNGYGWSGYVQGLISSGVFGEAADHQGSRTLSLCFVEPRGAKAIVQEVIDWAGSLLRYDPEHQGTPLQVDKNGRFGVTELEHIDVSGGVAPAIWAAHHSDGTATA
jgi:hypothetical protein